MSFVSFDKVSNLYRKSSFTHITRHYIEHPALGAFCVGLDQFDKALGESANEEYWRRFILPLKRMRFGMCAAPFREEYRKQRILETLGELKYHIRFSDKLYPHYSEGALAVLKHLENLLDEQEDPLLTKLLKLTPETGVIAWVVKESRLVNDVEKVVATLNLNNVHIVHPLQLKHVNIYDRIIVVGPSRWFPESIFTAPRTSDVHIVIFDWINDRWKPQSTFLNPHKSSGLSNRNSLVEDKGTSGKWTGLNAESLLIVVDKIATVNAALSETSPNEDETIEAICAFLEDDWIVFIDASEGSKTLVIDLEEELDDRIHRVSVKNIQTGTFILVRAGGGEDYIVPIADQLLGKDAAEVRKHQKHWKQLLRNHVRSYGLLETSIALLDLGSSIANEINVRNWMSPRSIRTQKYEDFQAIMRHIGLESETLEYWNMMERINSAHRSAGYKIRDLLFDQVKDLDINQLHKLGKMEFKLSEDDDGGITAFRVESVLEDTISIPYSRVSQPFKLDKSLWQE